MKKMENLTPDEMDRLALMFEIAPRLADAYLVKNEFLSVICCKSSTEGKQNLADWLFYAETMDVPWTNGYIEGWNNETKVLKRVSYGMPNFNNFRKRILFCNL